MVPPNQPLLLFPLSHFGYVIPQLDYILQSTSADLCVSNLKTQSHEYCSYRFVRKYQQATHPGVGAEKTFGHHYQQ